MSDDNFAILPTATVEPSERWVRVKYNGEFIADSRKPLLLLIYGPGRVPTYIFSRDDVQLDFLADGDKNDSDDLFGPTKYWHVKVGDKLARNAAWAYTDPPVEYAELKDKISFFWLKMEAWYEEEEQVFVHARDPHKRVDVMRSSRHVRIEKDGLTIAESQRPYLLFETHLPVRYYLPRADVKTEYLEESGLHTSCPYKGTADYWSVRVDDKTYKDLVWSYPEPIPEAPKIKELMAFYNEKLDIYIDGELQPRPVTPWS